MERYNKCSQIQKEILDTMYVYLGFNEIMPFDKFIEFMFNNATTHIKFENVLNHTVSQVVKALWAKYPEYRDNYIKYMWLRTERCLEHFKVGSDIEFDPKGVLRLFIKEQYKHTGK